MFFSYSDYFVCSQHLLEEERVNMQKWKTAYENEALKRQEVLLHKQTHITCLFQLFFFWFFAFF